MYFIWFVLQCTRSESLFPLMLVCWYWIACLYLLGRRNFYRLVLINSDCFRDKGIQNERTFCTWMWRGGDSSILIKARVCFREGRQWEGEWFGILFLASLILFFSGEPEIWGARDNMVGPVVRTNTQCREGKVKFQGRLSRRGRLWCWKCRRHERWPWRPVRGALWSRLGSMRKKSAWVWCAACLAQVYGARLNTW